MDGAWLPEDAEAFAAQPSARSLVDFSTPVKVSANGGAKESPPGTTVFVWRYVYL